MPTILLVEDDPALSRVIGDHLTEAGLRVIAEAGTTAALGKIGGEQKIDLLLSIWSCRATGRMGYAFAMTAEAQVPDVRVIFTTGDYGFVARVAHIAWQRALQAVGP